MIQRACSSGARILDLGCGPGALTVTLAHAGYVVTAGDRSDVMLELAAHRARSAGVADRVTTRRLDAHDLPFRRATFDAVVALGLLQWSHSPERVMEEMARVVKPGGYVVANVTNRRQLAALIDPARAALRALGPAKRLMSQGRHEVHNLHTLADLWALLQKNGLSPLSVGAFGYGPFTVLGREVVPDELGQWLQTQLGVRAREVPAIRRAAAQLLVLAVHSPPP